MWSSRLPLATDAVASPAPADVVVTGTEHGVRLEDGVARLARNRLKQLVKEMGRTRVASQG